MNGKGIKYYKNGNIKIKGTFSSNICLEGEYYNPSGNKIYEGEIHDGNYEGKGIEYCPLMKDKILFKGDFKNVITLIILTQQLIYL